MSSIRTALHILETGNPSQDSTCHTQGKEGQGYIYTYKNNHQYTDFQQAIKHSPATLKGFKNLLV